MPAAAPSARPRAARGLGPAARRAGAEGPAPPTGAAAAAPGAAANVEDLASAPWGADTLPLRQRLLAWYAAGRRKLPWRGDPPPWCLDKAALRRAAASEAEGRRQPRLEGFFAQRLRSAEAGPVAEIDLTAEASRDEAEEEPLTGTAFPTSAYGTWVSEVMLQQTQVERVVAYWTRWMQRFPTVQALAAADWSAVNTVWAGLGYYSRARRLHEGAKCIVERHSGEVPRDVEALKRIPGIGPYTAGAVAAIAYGLPSPAVDGNVIRVFARLRALPGDAASLALSRRCWTLAGELVDPEQPGAFNQALMELGATVCTPKAPACDRCPVKAHCRAAGLAATGAVGSVTDFPAPAVRKPPRLVRLAVAVVEDPDGRVLLVRRPMKGLLAGQWEFPSVQLRAEASGKGDEEDAEQAAEAEEEEASGEGAVAANGEDEGPTAALARLLREVLPAAGAALPAAAALQPAAGDPVEHAFSHERHTMSLYRGRLAARAPAAGDVEGGRESAWMTASEAREAGITGGVQRIFRALGLEGAAAPATAGGGALPGKRLRR